MEKIVSKDNKKVKEWNALHQKKHRDETGKFLVEGEHLIQEALEAGAVETILYTESCPFAFDRTVEVTEPVMNKISANPSGAKYIAVCRQMRTPPQQMKRVLLLDGIQDPGNLGTLVRTAKSFSFDAVFCSEETVDLYNDKTVRSTQGALFHIPVIRCNLNDLVRQLQKEGVQVVATTLEQAVSMEDIPEQEQMAFILGNEGQGVHQELQKAADVRLRIEMSGFESLNVAVAGGIIMYRYRKV